MTIYLKTWIQGGADIAGPISRFLAEILPVPI